MTHFHKLLISFGLILPPAIVIIPLSVLPNKQSPKSVIHAFYQGLYFVRAHDQNSSFKRSPHPTTLIFFSFQQQRKIRNKISLYGMKSFHLFMFIVIFRIHQRFGSPVTHYSFKIHYSHHLSMGKVKHGEILGLAGVCIIPSVNDAFSVQAFTFPNTPRNVRPCT